MGEQKRYPKELRERAVRLVKEQTSEHDSEWQTIESVAQKIGCASETLRRWIRLADCHQGESDQPTTDSQARIKQLEKENRELRKANEILKLASAYFAKAELDRPEWK